MQLCRIDPASSPCDCLSVYMLTLSRPDCACVYQLYLPVSYDKCTSLTVIYSIHENLPSSLECPESSGTSLGLGRSNLYSQGPCQEYSGAVELLWELEWSSQTAPG